MPRPKAKFLAPHAQSRPLAEPAPGSTRKSTCNDCRWSYHHIQSCKQAGHAPASRTRNGPASKQASESPMQHCAKQLMVWSPHPRLRTRIEQRAMHCKAAPSSRWSDHHISRALLISKFSHNRDLHKTTADFSHRSSRIPRSCIPLLAPGRAGTAGNRRASKRQPQIHARAAVAANGPITTCRWESP